MPTAMSHQLFYFLPDNLRDDVVAFGTEETRHMLASLRMRKGDVVAATDGAGRVFRVAIEAVGRGRATGRVLGSRAEERPRPSIWLFQGIVKPARMDFLVEKCVELGVAGLVPVQCARCVSAAGPKRLERWRRIAVEAMKQSLQAWLPEVARPTDFDRALAGLAGFDAVLVATEAAERSRLSGLLADKPARIAVWIGPEGGFADHESAALRGAGAHAFGIGRSRLRSETAALVSVALVGEAVAGGWLGGSARKP